MKIKRIKITAISLFMVFMIGNCGLRAAGALSCSGPAEQTRPRLKLTVITPEGKTFHSISTTGNVQLVSLPKPVLGTYHIYIDRINEFWHTTDFSVAVLNGDVLS